MNPILALVDRALAGRPRPAILALCLAGVLVVGAIDFLGGYEVSVSIFYLGPVAVAAWYADRRAAVGEALSRCVRESDIAARLGGDEFALLLLEAYADGAGRVVDNPRGRCGRSGECSSPAAAASASSLSFSRRRRLPVPWPRPMR